MEVLTLSVGGLQTNCYLAWNPDTKRGFVVDPGDDAKYILAQIKKCDLTITHILLTHGHFDHILALSDLVSATGAEVCIHADDSRMPQSGEDCLIYQMYPGYDFQPVTPTHLLLDGEVLTLAGESVTVLHTPGHTPGSVCFDTGKLLFAGDTLFMNSCGRWDLPGGDGRVLLTSLARLSDLSGDRVVYSGHGEQTTLARERMWNSAMRHAVETR